MQNIYEIHEKGNPSYKGHWDELFFGAGDFTWEFRKNKSVTYTFTGEKADISGSTANTEVEEPVVENVPAVEETTKDEETTSKKNNGNGNGNNKNNKNNKNKNK